MNLAADGPNGELRVDDGWVVITRGKTSARARVANVLQAARGETRISLDDVVAVHLKDAGRLFNGYIQFVLPGESVNEGNVTEALRDRNSLQFTRAHADEFTAVAEYVRARINERESRG